MTKLRGIKENMFGLLRVNGNWPLQFLDIKWYTIGFFVSKQAMAEGYRMPKRFGFAYTNFNTAVNYYYLIPFNLIIAVIMHIYFMIAWRISVKFREQQSDKIYKQVHEWQEKKRKII